MTRFRGLSCPTVALQQQCRKAARKHRVPPSERARIFEPFVRGSRSSRGSGLGLAIARGFVEANGGRIALQSGVSEDTAFAVTFPLVPQPAPAA